MDNPIVYDEIPEQAEEQCAPSDKQRLRIHVPYLNTTLTMGEKAADQAIRDEDEGDLNFTGFGATTEGHVFFDANGEPTDSMMRLQSKGHLTVQTPSKLALGGQEGSILASNVTTVVAGGGGVSIFGGSGLEWSDNQVNDATSPDSPGWISNLQTSVDTWSNFWLVMDAAVAAFGAAQAASSLKSKTMDLTAKAATAFAGLVGAHNAISNTLGLAGGVGEELAESGGTTIHGATGLILGSSRTAGLYSLAGTSIASPAAVSVSGLVTDVFGRIATTISSSRLASIASESSVEVVAGEHTLVTTRKGGTTIGGTGVSIGISADVSDANQDATESISLQATKSVLASAPDVALSASDSATIAASNVYIAGEKAALVNAGKGLMRLSDDEAVIGLCDSAPDLGAVAELESALADAYTAHAAALKTKAQKRSEYEKQADDFKLEALVFAGERADKTAETIDKLKSAIGELEEKKNAICFKSDGIEIVFEGTKMKLDSNGVKSGPIKWKKS